MLNLDYHVTISVLSKLPLLTVDDMQVSRRNCSVEIQSNFITANCSRHLWLDERPDKGLMVGLLMGQLMQKEFTCWREIWYYLHWPDMWESPLVTAQAKPTGVRSNWICWWLKLLELDCHILRTFTYPKQPFPNDFIKVVIKKIV